ncbi:MAG: hypothetical protein K2J08_13460 [Ruminococcus sp.]|nr:hypothetical protein [Ruminococcus sp.]
MTQEEIKVKNWLNRAFYAEKKVKALDILLRTSKMHAEGLDGVKQYNYTGKSDVRLNGTENAFLKLADIERKYSEQKKELENIFAEIAETIAELHDDDLETVLIHRYLMFHTIEQTAELMHYSSETVRRKTNKAIKKLCEKLLECGSLDVIE